MIDSGKTLKPFCGAAGTSVLALGSLYPWVLKPFVGPLVTVLDFSPMVLKPFCGATGTSVLDLDSARRF